MTDSNSERLPGAPLPSFCCGIASAGGSCCSCCLLNDMVEEIHTKCYENEKYRAYLDGVWDEQCVEGSLAADNFKAAEMIRERATTMDSGQPG